MVRKTHINKDTFEMRYKLQKFNVGNKLVGLIQHINNNLSINFA